MHFLTKLFCLLLQIYFIQCKPQFNEENRQNFAVDNHQQFSSIQNFEHSLEERHNERDNVGNVQDRRTAFAAPTNNILRPQQKQPFNSIALNGENKQFFKIHYRDGIQKAIFDETQRRAPPDFEESNDIAGRNFDIYDDLSLVEPHRESSIFVPLIYRNETSSEEASNEKKKLFLTLKPQKVQQTVRPLVAPELIGRQQISVRTTSPRPTTPIIGRPPSQQTFAQLVPSQTVLPIQPTTIRPLPQPSRRPPPQQPQFPQQGFQQQSRFISTPPTTQQTSFQTSNNPIPNENIASIRTGVCQQSIFYTTQQVTGVDILKAYTHFAVVVSVDQCARTCHEFNCEVAILDPNTRHCQFNPSTAFRLSSECPQWPNPLYRNNAVLGTELIRIQCITCQRKKKRVVFLPNAQRLPPLAFANLPSPNFNNQQQQTFNLRHSQFPQFNENNQNSDSSIQRVANAVKTTNSNSFGKNPLIRPPITAMGRRTELVRDGFHKINRLIKSVEEYFDLENDNSNDEIIKRNETLNDGNVIQRPIIEKKNFRIKEVTSWREGHPQGDGFSPLKINPLRNWRRPPIVKNNFEEINNNNNPLFPLQPIFHSTDSLLLKRVDGGITAANEFSLFRRRRTKRERLFN
uniref:Apple domain-containing protein n=2 Tax=Meloidogyne floridensis TaxID=298350 RepID=A0A915P566_9BILA